MTRCNESKCTTFFSQCGKATPCRVNSHNQLQSIENSLMHFRDTSVILASGSFNYKKKKNILVNYLEHRLHKITINKFNT